MYQRLELLENLSQEDMNIELNIVCLFLRTRVSLNRETLNKLCLIVVQSKAVVVIIQILYVTFNLKYHKGQFVFIPENSIHTTMCKPN
jgi:hypothetical protein